MPEDARTKKEVSSDLSDPTSVSGQPVLVGDA